MEVFGDSAWNPKKRRFLAVDLGQELGWMTVKAWRLRERAYLEGRHGE